MQARKEKIAGLQKQIYELRENIKKIPNGIYEYAASISPKFAELQKEEEYMNNRAREIYREQNAYADLVRDQYEKLRESRDKIYEAINNLEKNIRELERKCCICNDKESSISYGFLGTNIRRCDDCIKTTCFCGAPINDTCFWYMEGDGARSRICSYDCPLVADKQENIFFNNKYVEVLYAPGGIGEQKAKESFEKAANKGSLDEGL